jgi:hypothetical protein
MAIQDISNMKSYTRTLLVVAGLVAFSPWSRAADPQEGAFGQAFDTGKGSLAVAGDPAWSTLPLTVECRVKVFGKDQYNILVANETKASATHWCMPMCPAACRTMCTAPSPSWTASGTASRS